MPTYEYRCKNCQHTLEEFQSMKEEPLVVCPICHTPSLVRMIGGGAGLIFKGQGFYLTDYKKGSSQASTSPVSSQKAKKNGEAPAGETSKGDTNATAAPAAKTESSKTSSKGDTSKGGSSSKSE